MKLRTAGLILGLVWVASGAEAGLFNRGEGKLPKPIPTVNRKINDSHKFANRGHHPVQYQRKDWGSLWKRSLGPREPHVRRYLLVVR